MQIIPLSQFPAQTLNVVLDEQYCTISLYWRQIRLYLDLFVNSIPICRGAICQNRANILQSRSPNFNGTLHFFDLDDDRAPEWQNLNSRYILIYVDENEILPAALRY